MNIPKEAQDMLEWMRDQKVTLLFKCENKKMKLGGISAHPSTEALKKIIDIVVEDEQTKEEIYAR